MPVGNLDGLPPSAAAWQAVCPSSVRLGTKSIISPREGYSYYISAYEYITNIYMTSKVMLLTVYTQTSAFPYSLFYLHNQINNYKQTTKSTVCVNYDYATGYNTAVIQLRQQVREIPGKILAHY